MRHAGGHGYAVVLGLLGGLLALLVFPPGADAQAILDSGFAQIGMRETADLGVDSLIPSTGGNCMPPGSCSTTVVGLRASALNLEGMMDYGRCEGWGVSYGGSTTGYAQWCTAGGTVGMTYLGDSTPAADQYRTENRVGDLRITHHIVPSALPQVWDVQVTVLNDGPSALSDVRYRRVLDWDIEPNPAYEIVEIGLLAPLPPELLCSSWDPFRPADPTSIIAVLPLNIGPGTSCPASFTPAGPLPFTYGANDIGSTFDFQLQQWNPMPLPTSPLPAVGILEPGGYSRFHIFYGVDVAYQFMLADLAALGTEVYSIGMPANPGNPVTGTATMGTGAFPTGQFTDRMVAFGFGWAPDVCVPGVDPECTFCPPPPACPPMPPVPAGCAPWPPPVGPCPPTALFAWTQSTVCTGSMNPVIFTDLSLPYGTGDTIVSWTWDFGDAMVYIGPPADPPPHYYPDGGIYFVDLTVATDWGYTDVFSDVVTVVGPKEACSGGGGGGGGGGGYGAIPATGTQGGPGTPPDWKPRGNLGDGDLDVDGVMDTRDNCPSDANPLQENLDGDDMGDVCDADMDGDRVPNASDNCPRVHNQRQADLDLDGLGDACDDDIDADGLPNAGDNCDFDPNPDQADMDADNLGDPCDPDRDGDGIVNFQDCHPEDADKPCHEAQVLDDAPRDARPGVEPPSIRDFFMSLTGMITLMLLSAAVGAVVVAGVRRWTRRKQP